ncbi:MAG: bifunctional lysylphosphatidylglycerol flippase/synthetase MprF [Acidobacteria bacterium]|nr:bifunctional lysylphosphatidylglycerol flippase/synthetase MprF [Acidobacteriota bacterium]
MTAPESSATMEGALPAWVQRWLAPAVGFTLFVAALLVLRRELHAVGYHELSTAVFSRDASVLALAVLLTALNYLVLTGYDLLALRYVGRPLPVARVAFASFVAYAIQHNVGFGWVSGASVRYRFYSRWGVTPAELSRIVFFYTTTFWLGLLVLGGLTLLLDPLPALHQLPGRQLSGAFGALLLALCLAYAVAAVRRRGALRLGRLELSLPAPTIVAGQFALSLLDWMLAAAVAWVLLPAGRPAFPLFVGAFLVAQLLSMISHVPGGVGVFETLLVLLLKPVLPAAEVLPALLLFRVVYYLLPLALALVLLVGDELLQRRDQARRVTAAFGSLTVELAPRLLAVFVFLGGAVLLFSGATPSEHSRLRWLERFLPLGVLELSHFVGSVVGVGLLLLSRGIARRLDASWHLAVTGLGLGVVASLFKGGDYEEATLLALLLVVLVRARGEFDRKAAFFGGRFSPGWVAALVAVVGASVWLGFFSFRHADYSRQLWWSFELRGDASRFLRASVGAAVALLAFGASRLLRPAPPELSLPSAEDLDAAAAVIATQDSASACLVYMGDKAVLFDADRRGFVMYGVRGETWVALGDPVGPDEGRPGLVRAFLERCDDFDGTPVFYEVARDRLHLYADFGLSFVKLGEEARVPLRGFSLEGGGAKQLRQSLRRLEREGCDFRLLDAPEVVARLPDLRAVSDEWLSRKDAAEKGFSLGFFSDDYLRRLPVAVLARGPRIEAFANVWTGQRRVELSVDMMRYRETAPPGVMEALFVHLMLWGQQQGYQWFNLGMAPLSGLEESPLAPWWNRIAGFLFEYGEAFYNFQGLRAYKEKFRPTWEPRYLVYPGGLALPRIMADVAALVAGSYRRILLK